MSEYVVVAFEPPIQEAWNSYLARQVIAAIREAVDCRPIEIRTVPPETEDDG